jgi:uncharacterized protein YtpQ (UPF0354 family)
VAGGDGAAFIPSYEDAPILRRFVHPLLVSYTVDVGDWYELVQRRHLEQAGIDEEELHRIGLANLAQLVTERTTRVHRCGRYFALLMGGDFEASLMLLDSLWDEDFREFVAGDYAVAVPARDIMGFCDASSQAAVDELRQLIQRVWPTGDHLLSDRLYVRRDRTWTLLSAN